MYEYMAYVIISDNFNRANDNNIQNSPLNTRWTYANVPPQIVSSGVQPSAGTNYEPVRWYSGSSYYVATGSVRLSCSAALSEGCLALARCSSAFAGGYYYMMVANWSASNVVLDWGYGVSNNLYTSGSITGALTVNGLRIDCSGTTLKFYSSDNAGASWTLRATKTDSRVASGEWGFGFRDLDANSNMANSRIDDWVLYSLDGPISGSAVKPVVIVTT